MNDNSPDQDRYLALAREAFTTADHMKDPEAQATMRQIGGGYLAMARSAEKRERTIPGVRRPPTSHCGLAFTYTSHAQRLPFTSQVMYSPAPVRAAVLTEQDPQPCSR